MLIRMQMIVLFAVCFLSFASSASAQPVKGDWIVSGIEVVEGKDIVLKGNLFIEAGGSLTLKKSTLKLDVKQNGQYRIHAKPDSSLYICNCEIDSVDSKTNYYFTVEGAKFVLQDSVISNAGYGLFVEVQQQGIGLYQTEDSVIAGNTIHHDDASGIALWESNNATIKGNEIIHYGGGAFAITLSNSSNNLVKNNTVIGHNESIIMQFSSKNNRVIGNRVMDYLLGIVVRHGAGPNYIAGNKLYRKNKNGWIGLWADHTPFPNTYVNNTVRDSYIGAWIAGANNTILANNTFTDIPPTDDFIKGICEIYLVGTVYVLRSSGCYLLNNQIGLSDRGAVTLFDSSGNVLQGNTISDSRYGMALFCGADYNAIKNNTICNNEVNLILRNCSNNEILRNNFISAAGLQAHDNGANSWSRNYWDDWVGAGAYLIQPKGRDPQPLKHKVAVKSADIPNLEPDPSEILREDLRGETITGLTVWKNKTVELGLGHFDIVDGGKLIIKNCTVLATGNWVDESRMLVDHGGSLEIYNSKIVGNSPESPFSINVEPGASIKIIKSSLLNLGYSMADGQGLRILCDKSLIKKSVLKGMLTAISIEAGNGHRIIGNTISGCQYGIIVNENSLNNKIRNNKVADIANEFLDKLIK